MLICKIRLLEMVPKVIPYWIVSLELIRFLATRTKKTWYNDTDQASYSVRPIAGVLWTKKFDHWEGNMPSGSKINAAGSLLMDGPKKIKAVYELDLTYVSVIVAAVAAIPIALEVVLN